MSDYYRRRRVIIKDGTALMTFFLAFFWAGAFAWPVLADGVDDGDMTRGLAFFLAAVLGSAIVAGLLGLGTGNVLGSVWERYHRQHRYGAVHEVAAHDLRTAPLNRGGPTDGAERPASGATGPSARPDTSGVYYAREGVYAASFIDLSDRVRPDRYQLRQIRAALANTINIGAWDQNRLVGAVRVLTDGYTFSAIADIIVDPGYQRLGIGRQLLQEALAVTPNGRLFIEALPECRGFFERVGCDRRPTGFLLSNQTGLT